MPGAMPADLAERLSDVAPLQITAALLDQAREEIIENLLAGKEAVGVTFEALLDCELDSNVRSTVGELAGHLCSILDFGRDEHVHGERRAKLRFWMLGIVERWVESHPEKVRERAEEIAVDE